MKPVVPISFALALALALAGCRFDEPAALTDAPPPDSPDAPATSRLLAVQPAIATAGDTLVLEGSFPEAVMVHFPGGAMAAATLLGPRRATVTVPAGAGSGRLEVAAGGTAFGGAAFRYTSFALGLGPLQAFEAQTGGGRAASRLAVPRRHHMTIVAGPFLYALGGQAQDGTILDSIERARIHADGSLGAFAIVAEKLARPRYYTRAVAANGFVYVAGGATTGDAPLGDVERAAIGADGSLGAFAALPGAMVSARVAPAIEIVGDRLVVIGGNNPAPLADVESAELRADGTLGAFEPSSARLTAPGAFATSAVVGRHLYVIGAIEPGGRTIERAPIGGDGVLGAFTAVGQLTTSRFAAAAFQLGRSLFVVGGSTTSAAEVAAIGDDDTLGGFAGLPGTVPAASLSVAYALAGNALYATGGTTGTGAAGTVGTIARASIAGSGALGPMAAAPIALTSKRLFPSVATVGDALYLFGGVSTGTLAIDTIERATVGPDGALGAFEELPLKMLAPRAGAAPAVIGDFVYLFGGATNLNSAATTSSRYHRAPILPDGTLGPFVDAGSTATPRFAAVPVVLGGFVYLISGNDQAPTILDTIERAPILPDGTLGAFALQTGRLVTRRIQARAAVVGNRLYITGGQTIVGNGTGTPTIEVATIAADGTLGAFSTLPGGLGTGRSGHGTVVAGDRLHVVGGVANSSAFAADIETAALDAAGVTGPFAVSATLPARAAGATVVLGNQLYQLGGNLLGGITSTVDVAGLR